MVMVVEPSVAVSLRAGKDVLADPDFAGTSHVLEVFVLTDLGASSHSRTNEFKLFFLPKCVAQDCETRNIVTSAQHPTESPGQKNSSHGGFSPHSIPSSQLAKRSGKSPNFVEAFM